MLTKRSLLAASLTLFARPAWADAPVFEVGQVWSLKPPATPEARIRIGRLEGSTIHISLWGVPAPPGGSDLPDSPLVAGHLPISAAALAQSVDRVVQDIPPANLGFEEGYQTWLREANGGTFTITVMEIVEVIYETVRNGEAVER